jgi:hypothetical protein
LYKKLLRALEPRGPFEEQMKKTSIHLARKSAFAGIHPRKEYLILTVKADGPIKSPRIFKREQVPKSRWHHEVRLAMPADIDVALLGWLRAAYDCVVHFVGRLRKD